MREIASKRRSSLAAPSSPPVQRAWPPRLGAPSWRFVRRWVAPLDRAVFDAVNGLGYGPDVVFELLDPHERLYRGLLLLAISVRSSCAGPGSPSGWPSR